MSGNTVLKAELRERLGTGSARDLRRNGMIPAVVYGDGKSPISIAVEEKEVTKLYRKHGFKSSVIEIEVDGKKHKVLAKDVQLHPITELVRHADFVFLPSKGTQKVDVPVVYEGKERSLGVKRGGFFNIIHRKLQLICPVDNIPLHIELDVTNMSIGSSLRAEKIKLPEGCSLATKKSIVLASITGRGGKSSDASEGAEGETKA
jgi:large subunit ribosomal protein L25